MSCLISKKEVFRAIENYKVSKFMAYFYDEDDEFGDVKKKAVKPAKAIRIIRKPPQSFFSKQIQKVGQSKNVEDRRTGIYKGNHLFQAWGYLTRNTWFHLANRVQNDILSALQSRGFGVFNVAAWDRDRTNSQYYFEIHLRVFDGYSENEVKNSLVNTLEQTIALPGSIRFSKVIDYSI